MTNASFSTRKSAVRNAKAKGADIAQITLTENDGRWSWAWNTAAEEVGGIDHSDERSCDEQVLDGLADGTLILEGDEIVVAPTTVKEIKDYTIDELYAILKPVVPDVMSVLTPVTPEAIAAHVALAVVKAPTKKQRLRAFIAKQAVSVQDIATEFGIGMQAARSLIGDIQREGDKLVVEKVEGFRAGFYRYA